MAAAPQQVAQSTRNVHFSAIKQRLHSKMLKTATFYDAVLTFYNLFINMRAHTCHTKTVKTLSVLPILIHYLLNPVGGLILFFISFKRFNQWDFLSDPDWVCLSRIFSQWKLNSVTAFKGWEKTQHSSVVSVCLHHVPYQKGGWWNVHWGWWLPPQAGVSSDDSRKSSSPAPPSALSPCWRAASRMAACGTHTGIRLEQLNTVGSRD